jgi:hypothetical protein
MHLTCSSQIEEKVHPGAGTMSIVTGQEGHKVGRTPGLVLSHELIYDNNLFSFID